MSVIKGATIGMFDGVHLGHQYLLSQLKEHCDEAVAVTFTDHPLWIVKGVREPHLLSTSCEKSDMLRAMGVTPLLLRFDENLRSMTAEEFIRTLAREHGISRIVLGFNNCIGSDRRSAADDAALRQATGVEIIRATELPGGIKVNSSAIRELIKAGDVKHAAALLGRNYTLQGTVAHGKKLGRTIGFPTANIEADNRDKLIPAHGVYAADAVAKEGSKYRAVVNIGHRPTVDNPDAPVTIEAHLDGFSGDLYSTSLTLHFIERLRGERKFDSLDKLKAAIASDLNRARAL
ncbi:MAG: riboflavin biosynthesis protein RibF [Muribaculaceae bacterium]|nr:riboflavin biosynthesis protein RibF [Muribaculaceae bacterium]